MLLKCKYFEALSRPYDRESIFGYRVSFSNFENFRRQYDEIFCRNIYQFDSSSNAPYIIDCGSNIGISITFFKCKYPNSRILAFEPHLGSFDLLRKNVEQNNFTNVELINKAIANRDGWTDFYYDPKGKANLQSSTVAGHIPGAEICQVPCVQLSKYIDRQVDFLKMDIEGAELSVIEELDSEGKLGTIQQMAIEYHHHIDTSEDRLSELLRILEKNNMGYQVTSQYSNASGKQLFQDIMIYAYQKSASPITPAGSIH